MILADKIINLRKKSGLSQEELAYKIGVSRQAVSKWESAQSIPDLDKILLMSKLFGVSTDFLLKDELEIEDTKEIDDHNESYRKVTMEMANDYIKIKSKSALNIALGVALCILSPITLILLAVASEVYAVNENLMCGLGLITLFVMVAIAVVLFITAGQKAKDYEFLTNEPFETVYGVTGMVKEKKRNYQDTYFKFNLTGIILCILSVIPLFISIFNNQVYSIIVGLSVLLGLVALGVFLIVLAGNKMSPLVILLQEGDYTKTKKTNSRLFNAITSLYWSVAVVIYLLISFLSNAWDKTWIIWPIAGVLYGGLSMILEVIKSNKK